jgi:farnesyl-diphosphate farnesyltransferase
MADFKRLLLRTSRTFALCIPLLSEPLRTEVGIAYLLFRVADTLEDAARWARETRIAALSAFADLLRAPAQDKAHRLASAWVRERPCDHEGYLELLGETPALIAELEGFRPARRAAIVRHALRTTEGMADFVAEGGEDGGLRLSTLDELRRYCHVVAGIVGELLTELFIDATPALERVSAALWKNAALFGEGLQLVNILKDADADAREGRTYLPPGIERRAILAMARADLDAAADYVRTLQESGASSDIVAFTALPVLLARATHAQVERFGAGSTVSRVEVMAILGQLHRSLETGAPALGPGA